MCASDPYTLGNTVNVHLFLHRIYLSFCAPFKNMYVDENLCISACVIEMCDEVIQFMKYRFKITLILPDFKPLIFVEE